MAIASSMSGTFADDRKEMLTAFETYRKNELTVGSDLKMRVHMLYHIFRQYMLDLKKTTNSQEALVGTIALVDSVKRRHPHHLSEYGWKALRDLIHDAAYVPDMSSIKEKIKRSFLVELSDDLQKDTKIQEEVEKDLEKNNAVSDDSPVPEMYYDMKLSPSTTMLVEGYYEDALKVLDGVISNEWWKTLK